MFSIDVKLVLQRQRCAVSMLANIHNTTDSVR